MPLRPSQLSLEGGQARASSHGLRPGLCPMASSKTSWFASQGIWAQHWTRVMCSLASPGNCPTALSFQVQEGFGSRMQRQPDGVWRGGGKSGERVQRESEIQTGPEWSSRSGSHPASWRCPIALPVFLFSLLILTHFCFSYPL